jgi:hypothetical protein
MPQSLLSLAPRHANHITTELRCMEAAKATNPTATAIHTAKIFKSQKLLVISGSISHQQPVPRTPKRSDNIKASRQHLPKQIILTHIDPQCTDHDSAP